MIQPAVRAQRFFASFLHGVSPKQVVHQTLSTHDAAQLQTCLTADAVDSVYSATITLAEALQGLEVGLHTWATIELYYSSFYSARALMNLRGVCLFYVGKSPFVVSASAGERPSKASGNSHKVMLERFADVFSRHILLSQLIDNEQPLAWLMSQREDANYTRTRFVEPEAAKRFEKVKEHGVRTLLLEYLADDQHLFTFDPDHAMVALPLHLWRLALETTQKTAGMAQFPDDATRYLCSLLKDRRGPLAPVVALVKGATPP